MVCKTRITAAKGIQINPPGTIIIKIVTIIDIHVCRALWGPQVFLQQQHQSGTLAGMVASVPRTEYRVEGTSVLLTYQGLPPAAMSEWNRFLEWVQKNLKAWRVKHWCATLETNDNGNSHLHLMLQFTRGVDHTVQRFIFEGYRPNASSSDYLGEGVCKKKMQLSINRGMFYVYADKFGTQRDEQGMPCVAGNYRPCWEDQGFKYQVLGKWLDALWRQHKISHDTYERYIFLCRDNVLGRKRNLDAVREYEQAQAEEKDIEAITKKIRSNKRIYKPFPRVAQVEEWLALFKVVGHGVLMVRNSQRQSVFSCECQQTFF